MKTIGLIGGMSWKSTLEYYRIINEKVKEKLGGLHSAKCLLYSVDFAEIEELQHQGKWPEATQTMIDAARRVENGGADFLLICTNTMHKMADEVAVNSSIPLLHIADATAAAIKSERMKKIGLLGTKFTMEQDFYQGRLINKHGLQVLIPSSADREIVHKVIYNELCLGKTIKQSRTEYTRIMQEMVDEGAEGIILGCTEIGLLVKNENSPVPLFDTTVIHARAAVDFALSE
ncbi:MAG TPA: aspartate/glutamate racemase family protein [Bacteroidetes bacterium]|nr:aspartate/glutamate racemase family protein [Bacteroidota bacterium]